MFTRSKSKRSNRKVVVSSGVVAALTYLFDPRSGRARRAELRDKTVSLLRRGAREAARKTDYAKGRLEGVRHMASSETPPPNAPALTAKIESEVLSRWKYPKGQISVNSADGIVELRGTCEIQEQIDELEQQVRKVTGVVDVRNYLHLPDTPAPNKSRRT